MPILTKGVYGFETNPKKTPFGLLNNQQRANGIINAAAWFNAQGERLGTGDLSLKDMDHIAKHLPVDELFFVLTEADAGWNMPKELDAASPGREYVIRNAAWVIARTALTSTIIRARSNLAAGNSKLVEQDGVTYFRASREELIKVLLQKPKVAVKKKVEFKKIDNEPDVAKPLPKKKNPFLAAKTTAAKTQKSGGFITYKPTP